MTPSPLQALVSTLSAQDLWGEYFTSSQQHQLLAAMREGTAGALIRHDSQIALGLAVAAASPGVQASLGRAATQQLTQMIGRLNPGFGPGWQTRWADKAAAAPVARQVEGQVNQVLRSLGNNSELPFLFQDRSYELGREDVNGVLNGALRRAGSRQRVFVAPTGTGRMIAASGSVQREIFYSGTSMGAIQAFELEDSFQAQGLHSTEFALSDGLTVVAVLPRVIRTQLREGIKHPPINRRLDGTVQQVLARHVGNFSDREKRNTEILSDVTMKRQVFSILLEEAYGFELTYLKSTLLSLGENTLDALFHLYADLAAVEEILRLRATQPQQAEEALLIWALVKIQADGGPRPSLLIDWFLLPCFKAQGGRLQIDWERVASGVVSLKQTLHRIFSEICYHCYCDIVKSSGAPVDVKAEYDRQKSALIPQLLEQYPDLSQEMAPRMLAAILMQNMLRQRNNLGVTYLQQFANDMRMYREEIDSWLMHQQGLVFGQLPYNETPIVRGEQVFRDGKVVDIKIIEPDARIPKMLPLPEPPTPVAGIPARLAPWQLGASHMAAPEPERVFIAPEATEMLTPATTGAEILMVDPANASPLMGAVPRIR